MALDRGHHSFGQKILVHPVVNGFFERSYDGREMMS